MNDISCISDEDGDHPDSEGTLEFHWRQFSARFPTEQDCMEQLCLALSDGNNKCQHCGYGSIAKVHGVRTIECPHCGKQSWLTAGTFFHRIRSARPWMAAIWLLEHGVRLNSWQFHKLVGIAYSSALSILKKLTMVIQSQVAERAQALPSGLFGVLFCRRSRETPANKHPIAEQEIIEKKERSKTLAGLRHETLPRSIASLAPSASEEKALTDTYCQQDSATALSDKTMAEETTSITALSPKERQIYEILLTEEVNFDNLCLQTSMPAGSLLATLMMLELSGLIKSVPGDRYVSSRLSSQVSPREHSASEATMKLVEEIIAVIRSNFQGISRKYLQNYLAWYWCQVDRIRWQQGCLLSACLSFGAISYKEIISYVSPLHVEVSPCSP